MKKASLLEKRNPTSASVQKPKKAQRTNIWEKEQLEYFQGQNQ